jgi:predicted metal-dependent hydrolase
MDLEAESTAPLVLAFCDDLFLVPRLEDAARGLGYHLQFVDRPEDIGAEGPPTERSVPLTEPLEGPDAVLVRQLAESRPALLLFDLTSHSIPWERWIQVLKTSAATRRLPIVAFGPHVENVTLERARQAGADLVLTRGALQATLTDVMREWAVVADQAAISRACQEGRSELAEQGINHLKAGEFFEAHESLEKAWMAEPDSSGYLYRSMLQVAVAYLHIERGNYRGAAKLLLRLHQWLDPLPPRCRGVDVEALKANVRDLQEELDRLGPDNLEQLDPTLIRPIPLIE